MIFGAKNEPKVKDNCCGSHENSIGWVCNHFIVVASAPYDAAAMIGTFLKHPLPPSRTPNLICCSALW
jgi:hypothetical protein